MSSHIDSLSQDVTKSNAASFSAPSAVAGRAEPMPDKVCINVGNRAKYDVHEVMLDNMQFLF